MAHVKAAAARMAAIQGASTLPGCAAAVAANDMPWLRQLPASEQRVWLVAALPRAWSYFWEGSVTEGGFLRCVYRICVHCMKLMNRRRSILALP